MPEDGRMTVQAASATTLGEMAARGKRITFDTVRFIKFIVTEIFPGGWPPSTEMMVEHGEKAGFVVPELFQAKYCTTSRRCTCGGHAESNKDKAYRDHLRRGL